FSSRRRHTNFSRDWSSDVCSSDLNLDDRTAQSIAALLAAAEAVEISAKWEEFEAEAARAKDKAVSLLRAALVAREQYEAEQAEQIGRASCREIVKFS